MKKCETDHNKLIPFVLVVALVAIISLIYLASNAHQSSTVVDEESNIAGEAFYIPSSVIKVQKPVLKVTEEQLAELFAPPEKEQIYHYAAKYNQLRRVEADGFCVDNFKITFYSDSSGSLSGDNYNMRCGCYDFIPCPPGAVGPTKEEIYKKAVELNKLRLVESNDFCCNDYVIDFLYDGGIYANGNNYYTKEGCSSNTLDLCKDETLEIAPVGITQTVTLAEQPTCTDYDNNAIAYYVKDKIRINDEEDLYDYCIGDILYERKCDNNNQDLESVNCRQISPGLRCNNGRCECPSGDFSCSPFFAELGLI